MSVKTEAIRKKRFATSIAKAISFEMQASENEFDALFYEKQIKDNLSLCLKNNIKFDFDQIQHYINKALSFWEKAHNFYSKSLKQYDIGLKLTNPGSGKACLYETYIASYGIYLLSHKVHNSQFMLNDTKRMIKILSIIQKFRDSQIDSSSLEKELKKMLSELK